MGLDMYLYRKTYVKNWDHQPQNEQNEITIRRGGNVRSDIDPTKIREIVEEVAYWRKANAIHRWFVENIQGGEDDCGEYCVTKDELKELVGLCEQVQSTVEIVDGKISTGTTFYGDGRFENHQVDGQVVAQKPIAAKLLPTAKGFFFGSTDYDQYYLNDLAETIKKLKPLIDEEYEGDLYYHSSW